MVDLGPGGAPFRYAYAPSISADGRVIAFTTHTIIEGSKNPGSDVFVRDRLLHATEQVSLGTNHTNGLNS